MLSASWNPQHKADPVWYLHLKHLESWIHLSEISLFAGLNVYANLDFNKEPCMNDDGTPLACVQHDKVTLDANGSLYLRLH